MKEREGIPLPIQREVRKKCGFGCIICGLPIYEYHHKVEWSIVEKHETENIVLLCSNHHQMVTNGLIPENDIIQAEKRPINLIKGESFNQPLFFNGETCAIWLGFNCFEVSLKNNINYLNALIVDGVSLISFQHENKQLLLNINQYDENNNCVLTILKNELVYSTLSWDIEFVGNVLTIRDKPGKFIIQIKFNPPNAVFIERGLFYYKGTKILIDNNGVSIETKKGLKFDCNFAFSEGLSNGILIGNKSFKPGGALFHIDDSKWT